MKELKTVEKVICETLNGTFHNRIEYPDKIERRLNRCLDIYFDDETATVDRRY